MLKKKLADLRGCQAGADGVFLGVGSDEIIDLLIRITCVPGKDCMLIVPPTYGMYSVCAAVNDVQIIKVPLDVEDGKFLPHMDQICENLTKSETPPKLIFLTSPGNPTGTVIPPSMIRPLLDHPTWKGLVVVDEAYIDFADPKQDSAVSLVSEGYQNVIVLQTLSKGFGLAGIRLGFSFQHPELTRIMSSTKAPYNVSTLTADVALQALSPASIEKFYKNVETLKQNRDWLAATLRSPELRALGVGPILGKGQANFLLVRIMDKTGTEPDNARSVKLYQTLAETRGVVVRFRGKELGCDGCLRITVGSMEECQTLITKMKEVLSEI